MNRKKEKFSSNSTVTGIKYDADLSKKKRRDICSFCGTYVILALVGILLGIYSLDFTPDCNLEQFPDMSWDCKSHIFSGEYCKMWTLEDNDEFLRQNTDIYFLGDSRTRNLMYHVTERRYDIFMLRFTLGYIIDPMSLPVGKLCLF